MHACTFITCCRDLRSISQLYKSASVDIPVGEKRIVVVVVALLWLPSFLLPMVIRFNNVAYFALLDGDLLLIQYSVLVTCILEACHDILYLGLPSKFVICCKY